MRSVRVLCCAAALAAFLAPGARADEWNKLTYLTFSGPVQVPGATLPAGTYMFRLADTMTNRHVVQVYDKAGKKLFATMLAIPDQRLDASGKNVVLFSERPSGAPQAIRAWWYPGDTIGDEFVYPKSQAVRIARATHKSVLATEDEGMSDKDHMKSAKVGRVDENGTMTSSDADRNTAPSPAQSSTTTSRSAHAAAAPATPTTTVDADRNRSTTSDRRAATPTGTSGHSTTADQRRELPRTASELPLLELLSGLSLVAAFGAHQLRKRLAGAR